MFSGHLNLTGLSWILASTALLAWYLRVKKYSEPGPLKDLWTTFTSWSATFTFFLAVGNGIFWENPVFMRMGLITAHILMIPALLAVSKTWWYMIGKEMPNWWRYSVIGAILIYLGAEIYYAFLGFLPMAAVIREGITVTVRNDHRAVALLFIPAVWSSTFPLGFVLIKDSFKMPTINTKLRLIFMAIAWVLGSTGAVLATFRSAPADLLRAAVTTGIIYLSVTIVLLVKKPAKKSQQSAPAASAPTAGK